MSNTIYSSNDKDLDSGAERQPPHQSHKNYNFNYHLHNQHHRV